MAERESDAGLAGHFWTLAPNLRHRVWPLRAPASTAWSTTVDERVELRGRWSVVDGAERAVVVVHGLGGSYDRHYCIRVAREAERRGWSCLRLALRGADRRGSDFYHAGLVEDLDAALASEELTRVPRIDLLGFSLGGHVVLRWAALRKDPRVRAVAAVCPPLDLGEAQRHLDERVAGVYLRHVLGGLKEIYRGVAARAEVPTPASRMERVRTIREWDSLSIVPRWGFDDVDEYYRSQSVAPMLANVSTPALVVASRRDPMVRFATVEAAARTASSALQFLATGRGGHVGFPPDLDLGFGSRRGLEAQVAGWLAGRD